MSSCFHTQTHLNGLWCVQWIDIQDDACCRRDCCLSIEFAGNFCSLQPEKLAAQNKQASSLFDQTTKQPIKQAQANHFFFPSFSVCLNLHVSLFASSGRLEQQQQQQQQVSLAAQTVLLKSGRGVLANSHRVLQLVASS